MICEDTHYQSKDFWAYNERRLTSTNFLKRLHLYIRSKIKSVAQISLHADIDVSSCFSDRSRAVALGKFFESFFSHGYISNSSSSSIVNPFAAHQLWRFLQSIYYLQNSQTLKPSFAEPYEGILPIVFKTCTEPLPEPLPIIFKGSMLYGEVPEVWEAALVTACGQTLP